MQVSKKNIGKSKRGRPRKINENVEQRIIELAQEGKTNKEIAETLGLGLTTVRDARERLAATHHEAGNLPRGARGQDKQPRRRRHKLKHGDKCPSWLFGIWPNSPEWPTDEYGNPLQLIGWDSAPVGRRLVQGNERYRYEVAVQCRSNAHIFLEEKDDDEIHADAVQCYQEDMKLRQKLQEKLKQKLQEKEETIIALEAASGYTSTEFISSPIDPGVGKVKHGGSVSNRTWTYAMLEK